MNVNILASRRLKSLMKTTSILLRPVKKVRCLVELVWPLFLFAILMWVRSRGLKAFVSECHFQHKAMPSAGQLPFLQSFFCSFNNTCHSRIKDTEDGEDVYNTSTILEQLANDMELLFSNDTLVERWKKVQSINRDIQELSSLVQNVTNRQQNLTGLLNIASFMSKPEFLKEYVKNESIKLDDDVVDSVYNSKVAIQNISLSQILMLREDPKSVLCDKPFMMHFLITEKPKDLDSIINTFCNMPSNNITSLLFEARKEVKFEGVRNEMFSYVEGNLGRTLEYDQWRELNRLTRELADEMQALESYQDVLDSALSAGTNYRTIISALEKQNISTVYSNFILAQHFICGDNAGDIISQIADKGGGAQSNQFDSLKDQLKVINKQNMFNDYENDTDASPECNAMFKELEQNTLTRFLWLQIKPFFRGKILFSPKTSPAVRRIMDRVNQSFDSVSKIKEASQYWVNFTLPLAREQFLNNTENLQFIRQFVDSDVGRRVLMSSVNNSIVNSFYRNNSTERVDYLLKSADSLLTESNSDERATAFNVFEKAQINITRLLDCFDTNKTEGYDNEKEAEVRGMHLLTKNKFWALISFLDVDESIDSATQETTEKMQPFISYKIRMDSERVDDTRHVQDRIWHPDPRRRPAIDLKYITYGFAYLQDLVEHSIIVEQTGRNTTPGIFLQQYPYPCHIVDRFILAISRTFPMFMTLSWVYSCSMIVKSIVYEKERRLKETMRVMGLGNGVHWVGWFIDSIMPMIITIFLLTGILVFGRVLENSDPSVVFVFLLLYCITTITKSFLLSTLFSRANLAAAAGGIIFFIMYLPYPFMVIWESQISTNPKVIASLLSNVAFGFGCSYFAYYEEMGVGMQWNNIDKSPKLGDGYNLQFVMVMLMFDAVIYCILTWYIETVFPGQYGVPKPWYFLFQRSYWRPGLKTPTVVTGNINHTFNGHGTQNSFETEPNHLTLGVSIQDLCKVYGNGKVALKDLNMNFYEDQITSFLGHNGAGKTTTISILTGMFPPTSGTATIYNMDIRKDMDSIRSSLGMCPQHNVLFEHLTVEEHLWFYARLKNHPVAEVLTEIEQMLTDLGLPQKRRSLARTLSGGMQRKLSIAAAFIGGSKTVILDEPTSGVDPFSRRSIWELLIKYKKGRTVILTTHFMDEADLLGDRIAIIANGRLQCCGSSLFLKAKFGLGYYLTVETNEPVPNINSLNRVRGKNTVSTNPTSAVTSNAQSRCVEGIAELVRTYVPNAKLLQHLGTELVFNLPDRDHKELFETLFDSLDSKMAELGVISYGISDTTLEEIFLKVAEQGDEQSGDEVPVFNGYVIPPIGSIPEGKGIALGDGVLDVFKKCFPWSMFKKPCQDCNTSSEYKMKILDDNISAKKQIVVQMQGCNVTYNEVSIEDGNNGDAKPTEVLKKTRSLKWEQFVALNVKRFRHTKRNPKAMFCELVVPAMFVCMSLAFTVIFPKMLIAPPLVLEPAVYEPPNKVFFSNGDNGTERNSWSNLYQDDLLGKIGMSTECVENHGKRGDYCEPVDILSLPYRGYVNMTSPACSCSKGTPQCQQGAGGPEPPSALGSTGDMLANMTGRNISDWIVKTTPTTYQKRGYGGFSFGMPNPLGRLNITRILKLLELANNLTGFGNMAEQALTPELRQAASEIDWKPQQMESSRLDNIRVWFNNKGWVSSVAYMNAINNVVLRSSLPPDKQSDKHLYGIRLINHPMNFTKTQINEELLQQSGVSLLHAISVIFALSFVPASFVVFLIEERVSNAKHQQFVSGANRLIYWIAALCWDMSSYMFSAMLCILVFLVFNEQAYVSEANIVGLILLLLLYGWSSVPLMYPASFLFSIPSSAFVALACANLFIGIVTTVATFVLEIFDDAELQYIASILREVFLIFPQFCLGQGLMNMATRHLASKALATYGVGFQESVFDWNFLGKNLLCMLVSGAIFFSINLMIEFNIFKACIPNTKPSLTPPTDEEEDVAAERLRVTNGEADHDILLLKNLTKVYGKNRPAVDQISFGVKRGECFGLLGLNGAGKTSTFKMLTGDTNPSSGDAFVTGFSICSNMDSVRHHLGYCPQFDALDALLTPREHLQLYCQLRGIPSAARQAVVDNGLKKLGLGFYADRCAGTLSGGNKRKLSTAIALVGDPPLVFLDEPTSGMDPKARRFLWSCILDIVAEGRSVVLTSHSMEECEALCTKLTIMVNGKFKCFGSSQHLKSKFGCGYSLQVRCNKDLLGSVIDYVKLHLPSSTLRETHYNQAKFQLEQFAFKLADVFRVMEEARRRDLVQDYSISQTTLEEVFLRFAKEQTSETNDGLDESQRHMDV